MKWRSNYGTRHRKLPRAHAVSRMQARRDADMLAFRAIIKQQPDGDPPFNHRDCDVNHRKRSAAIRCARRIIWRLAESPECLASRRTMHSYLIKRGWFKELTQEDE